MLRGIKASNYEFHRRSVVPEYEATISGPYSFQLASSPFNLALS